MASRIEARANPELLVWARETAGFSAGVAADRLRVAVDRLEAWERGEARPSLPQLRKLAQLYRRPLAAFYLPRPPAAEEPVHDFRRIHGQVVGRSSPDLLLAIRRCRERREIALDLYEQLDAEPTPLDLTVSLRDDPEAVAGRIRGLLDFSFEEQRSWQDQYEAFRHWRTRLESAGVLAFQATDVEIAEARGFSIAERPLPAVVVNIKDSVYGRIFTLIHEFTHVLLNRGGVCDVDEGAENDHEDVEIFCNRVAGATIVPRELLLRSGHVAGRRGPTTWQDDVLRALSRTFHASRETILRRLLTLNLATATHYREKRRQFIAEYAQRAAQQTEGVAPHHRVQISGAGPLFTQLVVEAFNRERITASDVSDFLSIRVKHLPEIERDLLRRPA
jgi:Zn-dependent peptidase ImmA (M78 family)